MTKLGEFRETRNSAKAAVGNPERSRGYTLGTCIDYWSGRVRLITSLSAQPERDEIVSAIGNNGDRDIERWRGRYNLCDEFLSLVNKWLMYLTINGTPCRIISITKEVLHGVYLSVLPRGISAEKSGTNFLFSCLPKSCQCEKEVPGS